MRETDKMKNRSVTGVLLEARKCAKRSCACSVPGNRLGQTLHTTMSKKKQVAASTEMEGGGILPGRKGVARGQGREERVAGGYGVNQRRDRLRVVEVDAGARLREGTDTAADSKALGRAGSGAESCGPVMPWRWHN
jgi:hypothetical protein